jgi:poly-D-alanine transfer protein DltD
MIKYNPRLSKSIGKGGSIFVTSLQFLLNNQSIAKQQDGKKWVCNTAVQWAKYLGYSTRQIQRIVNTLRDQQIILVKKLSRSKDNSTNYYTINYAKLWDIIPELRSFFIPPHSGKSS